MNRAARTALVIAVVAAAGGAGIAVARSRSITAVASDPANRTLSTTKIVHKDLITYDTTTATLGFTTSVSVGSPVAGTITSIAASGDSIDAGSTVATIDGNPVVAMIGDVPGYRDLSTSSTGGIDIRQLKQNLALLGFDPEHTMAIDETFDAATKAVVTRWEDSLGFTGDGAVPRSEIVFIPGKLLVDTVSANIGGAATSGSTLLVGRQVERRFFVSSTVGNGGTVDLFLAAGTPVTTGTVLFWENYQPVVAIEGDAAALPALDRDLSEGVTDGADVKVLEQMLKAGGFDAAEPLTVDDHFDTATAGAVVAWWQALGRAAPADGKVVVPRGGFVVVPSGLFASAAIMANGTVVPADTVVQFLTTAAREVTTTAPVGNTTFAVGATIDVQFPDGSIQPGTVVKVGNVASNTSNVPGSTPSVPITIHVDNIPATVDSFVQIPVTLRAIADSVPNAFVVPVSALVALAEGGFGVEVVDGTVAGAPLVEGTTPTHLIAVTPGLFSDGFVSITGKDVAADLTVVVPA